MNPKKCYEKTPFPFQATFNLNDLGFPAGKAATKAPAAAAWDSQQYVTIIAVQVR